MIYNGDDQNTLDLINKYKGHVKFVNYKNFIKITGALCSSEHNRFDAAAALAVAIYWYFRRNFTKIFKEIRRYLAQIEKRTNKMERLFMMIMRIIDRG